MKKVINACLGGRNFTIDEDAYSRLDNYLEHFRAKLNSMDGNGSSEVMDDIESRIADLFTAEIGLDNSRVVNLGLVEKVTAQLGMPDGSSEKNSFYEREDKARTVIDEAADHIRNRKLYRDMDGKVIAGVCSGLAHYLNVETTLIRILMLAALIAGTAGGWIYIICWIAVPKAETAAQKCEMYGLEVNAENMANFSRSGYKKK